MNNGLLAYFYKGELRNWVAPGSERLRLRLHADWLEASPDDTLDNDSGDWHDITLTCASGVCRIADQGGSGGLFLKRREAPGPVSREADAHSHRGERLHTGDTFCLEDGDVLRFGNAHISYIAISRYLRYLPIPYHPSGQSQAGLLPADDAPEDMRQFSGRFLMIFESILNPIAQLIAQVDQYFSPHTAPASLLPYLLSWFGLPPDGRLSLEQQRALFSNALEIDRWRSTRRGLSLHIKVCCGFEPEVIEWSPDASYHGAPERWNSFSVIIPPAPEQLIHTVAAIVRMHQPVRTTCQIWVREDDRLWQWHEDAPNQRGA